MPSQLVFVEPGTAAWDSVWALLLAETAGDPAQLCRCCGEVWQYMGSYTNGADTVHEFRHRHSPITGRREYRRFTQRGELLPVRATLSPAAAALLAQIESAR